MKSLPLHRFSRDRAVAVAHRGEEVDQGIRREGRDWTENYLLHAFLVGNADWEVVLFSSWLWKEHPSLVPDALASEEPGSIWLRKTR